MLLDTITGNVSPAMNACVTIREAVGGIAATTFPTVRSYWRQQCLGCPVWGYIKKHARTSQGTYDDRVPRNQMRGGKQLIANSSEYS
jgi:hypothetical protein